MMQRLFSRYSNTALDVRGNNMISTAMLLAFFAIHLLCFQADIGDASKGKTGTIDDKDPHACAYITTGNKKVYQCCPGYHLNGNRCKVCPKGKYGNKCNSTCKCERYERCHHAKGCTCPVGKWGDRCGNNCKCYTRATCGRDSGECQCETGWIGDTCTNCNKSTVYPSGKNFCTDKCLHCFNGPVCDITLPGDCHCTAGWTGNKCNVSTQATCDSHFNNIVCRNHSDCGDFHICNLNTCTCDWCITGYEGEQCKLPCRRGHYGYGCRYSCDDACGSNKCHHISGDCKPCHAGYHGRDCNKECPANHYGYNCQERCQCPDKMTCDHKGECVNGGGDPTTSSSDITSKLEVSEVPTQGRPHSQNRVTNSHEGTTQLDYNNVTEVPGYNDSTISRRHTDPMKTDHRSTNKSDDKLITVTQGQEVNTITTGRTFPVTSEQTDTTKPNNKITLTQGQDEISITKQRTQQATRSHKSTTKHHYTQFTKTPGKEDNITSMGRTYPVSNDQKDTTKLHYSQITLTQGQELNLITKERTEPATRSRKGTANPHYNQVTKTQGQEYNIINEGRTDHVTQDKQSTMKIRQDNRISGGFDYIENNIPLVIGVCVFLVFLTIVNAVICLVCHRRRTRTANKRNVHYNNLDIGTERTNNLAMFLSSDDYEMVDVRTQVTTFLASDRQNGDDESTRHEGHRNNSTPENTQVDKTRKKKTKEVTNPEYSQITANYETVNDNSHNVPREDAHYSIVGEADVKQTTFTGNGSLSGQMYSVEGYSSCVGGAGEQADYNVVDRTGKSNKAATDNNELNNYEEIDITNEDVSTNEDTIYNKLNFGAKRLHYIRKSDYS